MEAAVDQTTTGMDRICDDDGARKLNHGISRVHSGTESAGLAVQRLQSLVQDGSSLASEPGRALRVVSQLEEFADNYRRDSRYIEGGLDDKITAAAGTKNALEEAVQQSRAVADSAKTPQSSDEKEPVEPEFTEAYLTDDPEAPDGPQADGVETVAERAASSFSGLYESVDDISRTIKGSKRLLDELPTGNKMSNMVEDLRVSVKQAQKNPRAAYQLEDGLRRFSGQLRIIGEVTTHIKSRDRQAVQQAEQVMHSASKLGEALLA